MVDVGSERVSKCLRSQDGRVGVIALAQVEQAGQASVTEVPEVQMVEAVLGTAEGEYHCVFCQSLCKLGEVLAFILAAVASSHDKDALQLTRLDSVNYLKQNM